MASRVRIEDNLVSRKRQDGLIELVSNGVVVTVDFTDISDLKRAVKLMEESHIKKCNVIIDSDDHSCELSLINELPYLEELDKKGYDINFYYDYVVFKKFPLKRIIEDEKRLNMAVKELNDSDLSPLEKLIGVYDITSFFKPYRIERTNIGEFSKSRNLHQYLDNNYMVCAGYADLFSNLCKRVGIESSYFSFGLENKDHGHARCYVHIIDPKYNVNGYLICDPTARRIGKTMYYNGLPMTNINLLLFTTEDQRRTGGIKKVSFGGFELSEEEFIEKARIYRNEFRKELYRDFKTLDSKFAKKLRRMNFYNEEDILEAKDYIDFKLNAYLDPRKLIEAVIQEKRFIFRNEDEDYFRDLRSFYETELEIDLFSPHDFLSKKIGDVKRENPELYGYVLNYQINNSLENEMFEWDPVTYRLFTNVNEDAYDHMKELLRNGYTFKCINDDPKDQVVLFPQIRTPEKYTLGTYIDMLNEQIEEYREIVQPEYYQLKKKK
jgi:hypothetical protein